MSALGGIGGRLYRGEVSFDFVGHKRLWYSLSGMILAISVVAVAVFGLNFSVDFKGGSVFSFPAGSAQITQVRSTVSAAGGGSDAIVQRTVNIENGAASWNVQTHPLSTAQQNGVENAIARTFHVTQSQINTQFVGPSWGSQISQKALQALIAFLIVIVIYLSIAFEWKMAAAALIANLAGLAGAVAELRQAQRHAAQAAAARAAAERLHAAHAQIRAKVPSFGRAEAQRPARPRSTANRISREFPLSPLAGLHDPAQPGPADAEAAWSRPVRASGRSARASPRR